MSEIRDIKPAEPMWPRRPVEKTGQEDGRPPSRRERRRRERRDDARDDDHRGRNIDEYA